MEQGVAACDRRSWVPRHVELNGRLEQRLKATNPPLPLPPDHSPPSPLFFLDHAPTVTFFSLLGMAFLPPEDPMLSSLGSFGVPAVSQNPLGKGFSVWACSTGEGMNVQIQMERRSAALLMCLLEEGSAGKRKQEAPGGLGMGKRMALEQTLWYQVAYQVAGDPSWL